MNNDSRRRLYTTVAIIVVAILFVGLLLWVLFKPEKKDDNKDRNLDSTSFYSPITQAEDNLTVSYSGDVEPNMMAVKQPFKIFARDSLPLSDAVKTKLDQVLPDLLSRQVTPTFPTTYVHIDRDTIRCDANDNCTMSLYIDSPERYFELSLKRVKDLYNPVLTQKAWKGLSNE